MKQNIEIKNRYTGTVIHTVFGTSLRGADLYKIDLHGADLYRADLREADLREVDLREADLREADLRKADLYGTIVGPDQKEEFLSAFGIIIKK